MAKERNSSTPQPRFRKAAKPDWTGATLDSQRVADLVYDFRQLERCPDGSHEENLFRAERELQRSAGTEGENMSVKMLCVGNLSNLATEGQLQGWFRAFGVSPQRIEIVRDGMSSQPLMLAFVAVADSYHASWAIACCDGQDFMGRSLTINEFNLPREHAL